MYLAHHEPEALKQFAVTFAICYPFVLLINCHSCALMIVSEHLEVVRRLQEHPCGCKCPKPTSPTGCGS